MVLGRETRFNYEYRRCGVWTVFIANEALAGTRMVQVLPTRTEVQWAHFLKQVAERWLEAERITLVMDNFKHTYVRGALWGVSGPSGKNCETGSNLFTPKPGSWLNTAEIQLQVLNKQCLNRHIDNIGKVDRETKAWKEARTGQTQTINWRNSLQKMIE